MKAWYLSKTLWLNIIAAIALLVQTRFGFILDPETQTGFLALINVLLRIITKEQLNWGATPTDSGGAGGGQVSANGEAGFINLRFLVELFLVGCMLLMFAGCATTSPTAPPSVKDSPQVLAGKSLLAVKSTIVVAATSIDTLCKSGTLPADKCAQAAAAYETAKPAYDGAVDAYLLMTSTGGDPAEFGRTLQRVQDLAANLLLLSGGAK